MSNRSTFFLAIALFFAVLLGVAATATNASGQTYWRGADGRLYTRGSCPGGVCAVHGQPIVVSTPRTLVVAPARTVVARAATPIRRVYRRAFYVPAYSHAHPVTVYAP